MFDDAIIIVHNSRHTFCGSSNNSSSTSIKLITGRGYISLPTLGGLELWVQNLALLTSPPYDQFPSSSAQHLSPGQMYDRSAYYLFSVEDQAQKMRVSQVWMVRASNRRRNLFRLSGYHLTGNRRGRKHLFEEKGL